MEANKQNPYANNRKLPVGKLSYPIQANKLWTRGVMLEYGEPELIFSIPRMVPEGNLINLGDAQGGSAILLAQGLENSNRKGTVITVDCYSQKEFEVARRNYIAAGVDKRITQMRCTTDEAYECWLCDAEASFVFIDAGHKYENVRRDWLNYKNTVVSEGIVAFHDTNQEDVDKVIRELVDTDPEWVWIEWVNRIKVFKKCGLLN